MFTVKLKVKSPEGLPKRAVYRILIAAMFMFPVGWNRFFKHLRFSFTPTGDDAKDRYRLAPRAGERPGSGPIHGSYTAKKLRVFKHTRALEFTGAGKVEALTTNNAKAGRTHSGHLWARASLPAVFNFRNPTSATDPPGEVTRVLKEENQVLDDLAKQKLDAEYDRAWQRN